MSRAIDLKGWLQSAPPKEAEKLVPLRDVVHELMLQGWDIVRRPGARGFSYGMERPRPGQPVIAEYRRACGATRRVAIPWPPTHTWRVPISKSPLRSVLSRDDAENDLTTLSHVVLDFRLKDVIEEEGGPILVRYEEVL